MHLQHNLIQQTFALCAGKGLYGIDPTNDTTFMLICQNVDYLDAKSDKSLLGCTPKPAPSFNTETCSQTRVNGLHGTG